MGTLRQRLGWVLLGLAAGVSGCGVARSAPPLAPGTYAAVIGRVEVIRDGKVAAQGETLAGTMTRIHFVNRATRDAYSVEVEEPTGAFMVHLPPGSYGVGMGHYIWIFDTPFEIEVPAAQEILYIGLLQVTLFVRPSFMGGWARGSGGAVPIADNDYRVLEESQLLPPPQGDFPIRTLLARLKTPAK